MVIEARIGLRHLAGVPLLLLAGPAHDDSEGAAPASLPMEGEGRESGDGTGRTP
jgi:hypothetical protein